MVDPDKVTPPKTEADSKTDLATDGGARKRVPSPVFWRRIEGLEGTSARNVVAQSSG